MASLKWCAAAFALIAAGAATDTVHAQFATSPSTPSPPSPACPPPSCFDRPVTAIVPFAPGGATDQLARAWGQALSKALNQPVVIANAAGAGGVVGLQRAARAAPDSHTLLFTSPGPVVVLPHVLSSMPVDPKELVPATMIGTVPQLLVVRAESPYKSLKDLIAYARANPGKMSFGTGGNGSLAHLVTEHLGSTVGARMTHIPYKGSGPAITDLLGGHFEFSMTEIPAVASHLQAGRLRALAITGEQRFNSFPDVPTFAQQEVRGLEQAGWFGVFLPAGTHPAIASRLAIENARIVADPEFREHLLKAGVQSNPMSAADFARFVQASGAHWGRVVKQANIKVE